MVPGTDNSSIAIQNREGFCMRMWVYIMTQKGFTSQGFMFLEGSETIPSFGGRTTWIALTIFSTGSSCHSA